MKDYSIDLRTKIIEAYNNTVKKTDKASRSATEKVQNLRVEYGQKL